MKNSVLFYLNGKPVTVTDPSPDLLLIDYLRSPEVGLVGAKKGCGEGGCGACTVILSHWNEGHKTVEHRSINSCLRPVCALGGLAVTTIEGTGAAAPPAPRHVHHAPTYGRSAAPTHVAPYEVGSVRRERETPPHDQVERLYPRLRKPSPPAPAHGRGSHHRDPRPKHP